jgi:hypothetical protein
MTVHPKIQPASEQERKPVAVVLDDFDWWYHDLPPEPRKSTLPTENDCSDFDGAEWRL